MSDYRGTYRVANKHTVLHCTAWNWCALATGSLYVTLQSFALRRTSVCSDPIIVSRPLLCATSPGRSDLLGKVDCSGSSQVHLLVSLLFLKTLPGGLKVSMATWNNATLTSCII
jgi:hypothetical protein